MTDTVIVRETKNEVVVREINNKVVVSSIGIQGPRGRSVLNGSGEPANNLGLEGDFYVNNDTYRFYGPKPSDITWVGAAIVSLGATGISHTFSWQINQLTQVKPTLFQIEITHSLGFYPNVTVQNSAADIVETEVSYNNINKITLSMAQPFAGTAYLS